MTVKSEVDDPKTLEEIKEHALQVCVRGCDRACDLHAMSDTLLLTPACCCQVQLPPAQMQAI
jgi:hypothetical protein